MEKINVSKKVTATILSMSLLTVMAGAAIAPALGIIKAHFSQANDLLVQLIVSMPALLIIVTNLFFLAISRLSHTILVAFLALYIINNYKIRCKGTTFRPIFRIFTAKL